MSWAVVEAKRLPALEKPVVLVGLPGIGNVGTMVVDFLIENKRAVPLARFHSSALPHTVFVNDLNLVEMPTIELFGLKNNGGKDLLLVCGDTQPIDERACHEFCEVLLEWCQKFGAGEVVAIGGIALKRIPKKPKLFVTGTAKKHVDAFAKGTLCDPKLHGVVGPIIGVTGLVVAYAGERGLPNACLLAETYGHPMYLGVPSAREILKVLDKKYALHLDLSSLDQEIQEMEAELRRSATLNAGVPQGETSYIG